MGENNSKEVFGQTLLSHLLFTFVWHSVSTTLFLVLTFTDIISGLSRLHVYYTAT